MAKTNHEKHIIEETVLMNILKQKIAIMRSPAKRGTLSTHQSTFEWLFPKMWLIDKPNVMNEIKTQLARAILRSSALNSARNFFSASSVFNIRCYNVKNFRSKLS